MSIFLVTLSIATKNISNCKALHVRYAGLNSIYFGFSAIILLGSFDCSNQSLNIDASVFVFDFKSKFKLPWGSFKSG